MGRDSRDWENGRHSSERRIAALLSLALSGQHLSTAAKAAMLSQLGDRTKQLHRPFPVFLNHTPMYQLLFNIFLVHIRSTNSWQRGNFGKLPNSLRCSS